VTVLHSSLPYGNLLGQTAALLCGVRLRLTTCENPSWARDHGNLKQELIDRLTYRVAHRVIACTELARDYLARHYRIPTAKLMVIPHSLKVSDYEDVAPARVSALRAGLDLAPGDFVVGMVARLERWKGHRYVIEAMRRVVREQPGVRLLIFGSRGDAYDEVHRAIEEYGLQSSVAYKGFVEDSIALYRVFDIHVHTPINAIVENTGINIIEGMISGCAQILTRSGFSYYLARHLENAWVVDYCSADDIAKAILTLKADPALRRRLGQNARMDALRLFDYRDKVTSHLAAYGMAGDVNRTGAPSATARA
jgi:glycosyltransferase involved in cell wall biosynthesis